MPGKGQTEAEVRHRILVEIRVMKKSIAAFISLVTIAIASSGGNAETLSPNSVLFEGNATTTGKDGTTKSAQFSIQSWGITGKDYVTIPIHEFYVAHLISGQVSAKSEGQTVEHLPGDYWTVKPSQAMQIKAVGEIAVLETIVVSKP
jgi:hypothetical protein